CSWHVQAYNHVHGEENLLGFVHPAWIAGRFPPAILVGLFRHNPHPLRLLVDCVPQRLVLALPATRRLLEASTVPAGEKTPRVLSTCNGRPFWERRSTLVAPESA